MFKITKDKTFEREVTVVTPTDTGFSKGTFTGVFKYLPYLEAAEFATDEELARGVLKSVKGVADEGGTELSADDALEAVLADTCAITAIASTYMADMKNKNIRRKN